MGCYACQDASEYYGCKQTEDMNGIAEDVLWADCIALATPIYSWCCIAEMEAAPDRLYGLNKLYVKAQESLWAGKRVAIIAPNGYEHEYATQPFSFFSFLRPQAGDFFEKRELLLCRAKQCCYKFCMLCSVIVHLLKAS
ncbi:MAG TPA: NAD(P)H-dependent oxidoreductase [Eubacteriales bacterium]|nr:NAD(P)H-dependent oxidoreductase [Clostridia bacterium]HRV73512.1 NAD(P)H-dependent oxidoreductase [Eubacteriales bacterium]